MVKTVGLAVLLIGLAIVPSVPVSAHQLPLEVEAYFKVEGTVLQVLVRLPLATLADVSLPLSRGGALDLAAVGPTIKAAADDFVKNAGIADGGRPLAAHVVSSIVAVPTDPSFATYETANAHLRGSALPLETVIEPQAGFIDLHVDYALTSRAPRLSVRFNSLRVNGRFLPTRTAYLAADGSQRRFVVAGPPQRVSFEPSRSEVATMFATLGIERVAVERSVLLLLFCLAIPLRTASAMLKLVGTLLTGYLVGGILAVVLPSAPGLSFQSVCALVASAALVLAAIQIILVPQAFWVRALCLLFGVASGVGIGVATRDGIGFAGSHGMTALTAFLGTSALGFLAVASLLHVIVAWSYRLPLSEPTIAILLTLIPLHTALHQLAEVGETIGARANLNSGQWAAAVAHWPSIVAVLGLALLALISRFSAWVDRAESG